MFDVWNVAQRWHYEKLGILKHQSFNLLHRLFNVNSFIFTTFCPIFYIACCMLGFIHFQSVINIFTFIFLSIEALMFLKKQFFRVGKKALGQPYSLTSLALLIFASFGIIRTSSILLSLITKVRCGGLFERLGNVYRCEGLAISLFHLF